MGGGGIPPQLRLGWNTSSPDPIGWAGCSRHTNRTGAAVQTAFKRIWAHVPGAARPQKLTFRPAMDFYAQNALFTQNALFAKRAFLIQSGLVTENEPFVPMPRMLIKPIVY